MRVTDGRAGAHVGPKRLVPVLAGVALIASGLSGALAPSAHASPSDGTYEVTSVSSTGVPTTGQHLRPQVSSNGRYVAFDSDASSLVPDDTGGFDTFVRDRVAGTTERATVADDGSQGDGGQFFSSSRLSADGRNVIFTSTSTNLVAGDTNAYSDVFLRDLDADTTELVSVGPSGQLGNSYSQGGDVSANGRYVVFSGGATNWGISAAYGAIWLRDRQAGTTTLVIEGNSTIGSVGAPRISADGGVIAFIESGNDAKNRLYAYDRGAGTTQRVDVAADGTPGQGYHIFSFDLSNDGSVIAFEDDDSLVTPDATNANYSDIYVRDLDAQTTELASVSSSGVQAANTAARDAVISDDGRFVGFTVEAGFIPPPPGGWDSGTDVYVHDRVGGTTWHVGVDGYGVNSGAQVGLDGSGLVAAFVASGNPGSGLDPADGGRYVYTAVRTPDNQAPSVTGSPDAAPNAAGWYAAAPTISWSASDPFPSWGQPSANPPPVVASTEGTRTYTSGSVCDRAANCATGSFVVRLDRTAPTAAVTRPASGAIYGLSQTVTAAFTCADTAGSGVASCVGSVANNASLDTTTVGSHAFTVTATDRTGHVTTVNRSYSVEGPVLAVSTTAVPAARVGQAYSSPVQATGGAHPYLWSVTAGALPPGLSLGASTGTISGTPTTPGPKTFTIQVADSTTPRAQKVKVKLTMTVAPSAIVLTPTALPQGARGVKYSASLAATGGSNPYKFAVAAGALPPGVKLSAGGVFSAKPTVAGVFTFTVRATDKYGYTGTRSYSVRIT